jgi:hypothetical protein
VSGYARFRAAYSAINNQYTEYSEIIDETFPVGQNWPRAENPSCSEAQKAQLTPASDLLCGRETFGNIEQPEERPMTKMFSTMTVYGLLTVSGAYAQSGQPIQANIPFAFRAQSPTFAAGTYQLTYSASAHRLMILRVDQNADGAFAIAMPTTDSTAHGESGKLVFDCYEKTCYLARVWQGKIGSARGLEVSHPKPDREVALATRIVTVAAE